MKFILLTVFFLCSLCSCMHLPNKKIKIYKEGYDVKGTLNKGDKIVLGVEKNSITWKLIRTETIESVFEDEKGREHILSNSGFLPGSIITKFKRIGEIVEFSENPIE